MSLPSSNWAAQAFQKTFTNVFYSRVLPTRRRRSRRPAQQISLESLEPRQMLAADASASIYNGIYEAYTNSAAVGAVNSGMPSANYWSAVSSINGHSVVAANGQPGLASLNVFNGGAGVFVETLGYSMILAALYDDKTTFDRLSATVQVAAGNNSAHPGLMPWAMTGSGSAWSYTDPNSAADGDINIALAYVYADKAASVYGWAGTPGQGGSSYHQLALNYITAIREQDFAQDDPNRANRYLLAEGAIQTGNLGGDGQYYGGFQDSLWHYDYADPRAYELFAQYDPTVSADIPTESFWETARDMTVEAYKAIFYFGSADTGRVEAVVQGAIDPATKYVKLSNNSYQDMQASFGGYKSFDMNRQTDGSNVWNQYTADCQRFPIRWSNYLNAHVDDKSATSVEWQIGLTNLQSLGASFMESYDSSKNAYYQYNLTDKLSINPTGYANATSYSDVNSWNAAGLNALTKNPRLQGLYPNSATIESYLDTYFGYYLTRTSAVPSSWGGYSNNQYGPNQVGFHGESTSTPDAFQDSLTLWGLTVSQDGWTPLQDYMVQYDPSATVATVPSAPTSVVAVSGNASLAVTWTAPTSTGGSPITDYLVKYSSNSGSSWTTFADSVSTATSCTVTGLANGTSYVIKVIAKNAVGISLPSANSAPVTPATVPGAPTSVVAVSGNTSLAVTWVAPTSTGGSAITDYTVKYSSNNGSTWTTFIDSVSTATSCTVTNLTNGTPYVIKVIAKNAVGISLPSANSAPVTPATVPGAPTSVVAVSGNTSLAVTWVAPTSTGGSPITDYLVKYSSNSGSSWTTFADSVSTATSCTVTGLANGTAYVIKVIAKNAVGISLPSANSALATPATVPGSPTSVTAKSGDAQLTVTWTAPANTGGSKITDYLVKYSSNGGVAGSWKNFDHPVSTVPSLTVTGLTNGISYVVKVIARNEVDFSSPSVYSLPVMPVTIPNVPRYVVAVRGNAQLTVTWTAPTSTGGSAITDYQVKYSSNNGVAGSWRNFIHPVSTDLWCTVTGLTNGRSYVIKVIARNAVGISLPSANSAPVTPALLAMSMVTVGNFGNAADTNTGSLYGAVPYFYQIGAYDVTGSQYTAFLNAVGSTDTYALYNASMGTDTRVAQISQSGSPGTYTYAVMNSTGQRPISYVSWFDSARFSNWMSNGQPSGAQVSTTTENGAYNVNGVTLGNAVAKNVTNPNTGLAPTFRIPLQNEWYKAAYYSPNYGGTGVGGYYRYATQSNSAPGTTIGNTANQANYNSAFGTATDVGAFSGSGSFYGTFDQSGNVYQWNDLDGTTGSSRWFRGGAWYNASIKVSSSSIGGNVPSREDSSIGFRLASPV